MKIIFVGESELYAFLLHLLLLLDRTKHFSSDKYIFLSSDNVSALLGLILIFKLGFFRSTNLFSLSDRNHAKDLNFFSDP